ncbi:MAG: NAD(P)-dependent oxidoreductase [Deltaproteobacteria bacterium]|nr:NAD(P)-dependent oxidoreductase [Deltaproteobacteria bacterium]
MKNKTVIITGASRGVGEAIACRCALEGANVVVAAKTAEPHPKLSGTIFTVAEKIKKAGGSALAIQVDVREESQVEAMVQQTVEKFGQIDCLINNAGAISLTDAESTPMKRYDLMQSVNARAVFLCSQMALPWLKKSANPHIINLSPPISLDPRWLKNHLAYTISKYGMTLCTLGLSAEFEKYNIAVNSLWPKTVIATAAIEMLLGEDGMKQSRSPDILADAALELLKTTGRKITGQTLIDEDFLRTLGVKDFEKYSLSPGQKLLPDLFVDLDK